MLGSRGECGENCVLHFAAGRNVFHRVSGKLPYVIPRPAM